MRIVFLMIVLLGSAFAQYQQYPKFYASPSETWINEQMDTTRYLGDMSRKEEGITRYHFSILNRPDSLRHVSYLFWDNRLQQRKLIFSYRGDLETTFKIANQFNSELLWKYIQNSQTTNPADSGKFVSRLTIEKILSNLKEGVPYTNLYGLANGDMITFRIWYDTAESGLVAEMNFNSHEFRKAGAED